MSQPPQDPQAYPWGAREPHGASPAGAQPAPQPAPQPSAPPSDPYGGGQYAGAWTEHAEQPGQPYVGRPDGPSPFAGRGDEPRADLTGYRGERPPGGGEVPTSTVVLLAISGISVVTMVFALAGIAPLVLSIVALTRAGRDEAGARRLTRIGWVVWAVLTVLTLLALAGLVALLVAAASSYDPAGTSPQGPVLGAALGLG